MSREILISGLRWITEKDLGLHFSENDVRPAFEIALREMELEGLIPGEASELLEAREQGALAELRAWLRTEELARYSEVRVYDGDNPEASGARRQLAAAIKELDRIAVKVPPAQPVADRFRAALKAQGVDLGADATEAALRALAAMDGAL